MHKMYKFHSNQFDSHQAMVNAMKVKRSIYFAKLQGYVIFETELYIVPRITTDEFFKRIGNAEIIISVVTT